MVFIEDDEKNSWNCTPITSNINYLKLYRMLFIVQTFFFSKIEEIFFHDVKRKERENESFCAKKRRCKSRISILERNHATTIKFFKFINPPNQIQLIIYLYK